MVRKKIIEKIEDKHKEIADRMNSGDPVKEQEARAIAAEMKKLASKAILKGIDSDEWREYMKVFAKDDTEHIQRLNGEDTAFNETEWGYESLAYVVANSTCDVMTTGRTDRDMPPLMRLNLDYGLTY